MGLPMPKDLEPPKHSRGAMRFEHQSHPAPQEQGWEPWEEDTSASLYAFMVGEYP